MIPVYYLSGGFFHPCWFNRLQLREIITRTGLYALREVGSLERLSEEDWETARVFMMYMHARTISPAALERLDAFVREGGGLLAVHSAAASFKCEERFHALLGGRFVGHGPVGRFEVQPAGVKTTIFSQDGNFRLRDERYLHETYGEIQVQFSSCVDDSLEPFVWTRQHGGGRVCYCAAGHTLVSLRHPAVQTILREGLAWAAGDGE